MVVAFIEKRRKELKISQKEMADRLKISRRQYQRIESGENRMTVDNMEVACDVIGCKVLIIDKALLE